DELVFRNRMGLVDARGKATLITFNPAEHTQDGALGHGAKGVRGGVVGTKVRGTRPGAVAACDDEEGRSISGRALRALAEHDDGLEGLTRGAFRGAELGDGVPSNLHHSDGRNSSADSRCASEGPPAPAFRSPSSGPLSAGASAASVS